jgi:hypothetical protein
MLMMTMNKSVEESKRHEGALLEWMKNLESACKSSDKRTVEREQFQQRHCKDEATARDWRSKGRSLFTIHL